MNKQDKQFLNIKKIYPNTTFVFRPFTQTTIHDVYIIESLGKKYICRFSDKFVAQHNLQVSKILTDYKIPVPVVSVYNFGDCWCETYPFIYGKTLHERLIEGLSGNKLDNIYCQLFEFFDNISNIPSDKINSVPISLTSKIIRKTFDLLNPSDKKLCHTDLQSKNIILNESDDIRALIDLDSVMPGNLSFAKMKTINDAQIHGYDIHKFETICTNLDIKKLEKQIKNYNLLSSCYKVVFPELVRKQLLKIRVK